MAWQLLAHDATIARKTKLGHPFFVFVVFFFFAFVVFLWLRLFLRVFFFSFLLCCVFVFILQNNEKNKSHRTRVRARRSPANQTVNSLPDRIKLNRTKICQCFLHFGLISVVVFISVATFVLLRFLIHTHDYAHIRWKLYFHVFGLVAFRSVGLCAGNRKSRTS